MTNKVSTIKKTRDIYLDAVKGFLILCIVLEHNHLLTAQFDWIRPFSDAFAAGCFLILTFTWPLKQEGLSKFVDKNFSYWWPFIVFVTLTTILNWVLYRPYAVPETMKHYIQAIVLSSPEQIKTSSGFMYFWFLPCLCFLYLTRRFLDNLGYIAFLLGLVAWLLVGELDSDLLVKTPFSLHVIAFILIIGLCYQKVHKKLMAPSPIIRGITITLFISGCFLSYSVGWKLFLAGGIIPSFKEPLLLLYYSVFMLIAIPGIYNLFYCLPKFLAQGFAFIGKHSLKVYIFHPLIYIGITQVVPLVSNPLLSFIWTIIFSLLVSHIIHKMLFLERFLFPSTVSSLMLKRKN